MPLNESSIKSVPSQHRAPTIASIDSGPHLVGFGRTSSSEQDGAKTDTVNIRIIRMTFFIIPEVRLSRSKEYPLTPMI